MDLGIAGKWALVCAASKGLGKGCAQALVREGVNVVDHRARRRGARGDRAQSCARCGRRRGAQRVAGDITTPKAARAALAACPQVDILVNNAGGPPPGDFRDWDRDAWIKALDANMLTPIELIKATVDAMAARGFGRIVNITSGAVKAPIDILGLSNGARSGLTGFVAGLARSAHRGQGRHDQRPAARRLRHRPAASGTDGRRGARSGPGLRRGCGQRACRTSRRSASARAEEFGAVCAFLCSVHAGYITGQNVLLDGGAYPGTF